MVPSQKPIRTTGPGSTGGKSLLFPLPEKEVRFKKKKSPAGLGTGGYRGVWLGSRLEHWPPNLGGCRAGLVPWNSQDKSLPPHGVSGRPKRASGLKEKDHLSLSSQGLQGGVSCPSV